MRAIIIVISWLLCASAMADVTADVTVDVTQSPGVSGGTARYVIYLQDDQLKVSEAASTEDGATREIGNPALVRLTGQAPGAVVIQHGSRSVQRVATLTPITSGEGTGISSGNFSLRVVPSQETRRIGGLNARKVDFSLTGNVDAQALLGPQATSYLTNLAVVIVEISGTAWAAQDAPGASEVTHFLEGLSTRRIEVSAPNHGDPTFDVLKNLVTPDLTAAVATLLVEIGRHGMPLTTHSTVVLKGDANSRMGFVVQGILDGVGLGEPFKTETHVTRTGVEAIAPERFYNGGLPAGYRID